MCLDQYMRELKKNIKEKSNVFYLLNTVLGGKEGNK